eukprot:jgi/Galph1/957/GphlegSOOS_G5614.1
MYLRNWVASSQKRLWRNFYTTVGSALPEFRTCVVGSGPAALYATEALLRIQKNASLPYFGNISVDIFEKLPTPFGLLRYGVAPDHPEVRNVENKFEELLSHPQVRFFGNVEVGKHIRISELRQLYHAIILATGAQEERKISIPGEDSIVGVHSAREFVAWYCGHPDYSHKFFDFSSVEDVVIIGQGNVALDVARIVGKSVDSLKMSDISSVTLQSLSNSRVKNIHIVGRRGPAQASWTAKELRECLFSVKELVPCFEEKRSMSCGCLLSISKTDQEELLASRGSRRCYELLQRCFAERVALDSEFSRKLYFRFLWSPTAFHGIERSLDDTGSTMRLLNATSFRKNHLVGVKGQQRAVLIDDDSNENNHWNQKSELAFKSIGYLGKALESLPFNESTGTVPNKQGRVLILSDSDGKGRNSIEEFEDGLYVTGWLKRGPTGVIGSNKWDAEETVNAIVQDICLKVKAEPSRVAAIGEYSRDVTLELLAMRNIDFVDVEGWKRIDRREKELGRLKGKEREKILSWEELLQIGLSSSVSYRTTTQGT